MAKWFKNRCLVQYKVFALFFFSVSFCLTFAQKPKLHFDFITTDDGLSSNNVKCILEDVKGFIWFGTNNGLNRFDGYSMETFMHDPKDSTSIIHNAIRTLINDKKSGNIWIGTPEGLALFNRCSYSFTHFKAGNQFDELSSENIFDLAMDKDSCLLIATSDGLNIYDTELKKFYRYYPEKEIPTIQARNHILSVFQDSKERIWVGTTTGLCLFDANNKKFYQPKSLSKIKEVVTFCEDSKNNIWIGSRKYGLFLIKDGVLENTAQNFTVENGYLGNNRVYGIFEDEKNNLLIANRDGGLIYFNRNKNTTYKYLPNIYTPNSINSKALISGLKTKSGDFYFGTYRNGINFLDGKRKKIEHYKINFREDGLFNNNTRSMYQDTEGFIWVGTTESGGLSRFDRETGTFKNYPGGNNSPYGLKADYILSISEPDKNNLLLGTLLNGVLIFNKPSEQFKILNLTTANGMRFNNAEITAIKNDRNGNIWLGSRHLLLKYNLSTKKTVQTALTSRILVIYPEEDEKFWIGTGLGLYLFNDSTSKIEYYSGNDSEGLPGNARIASIVKGDDDKLWLATNKGLLEFDINSKNVTPYTVEDGLLNNRVEGILKDEKGNLWASTAGGISKFNIKEKIFLNLTKQDGLQGNEFENTVCLKLDNGEMMFGGRNGFNIFHPDEIEINNIPPKVYIIGFKLFNKTVPIGKTGSPLEKHITETDEITLDYKQSVITLDYVALNFSTPEKNQYKYMLEGFDKEWVKAGTTRSATYTNLPPYKYTFKVKASNNDGVWSNNPVTLKIKVLPPWWNTWGFRISALLLLLGFSFAFYFIRMRQMKATQLKLEKEVKERTNMLQEANVELEEKQEKIKEQNNDLIASEEKLRALNEELHSKNEMLLEQKEELESILYQLKETQSQLILSEKMASIGILTAGIAHELNNPLNFIQSGVYAIENYFSENSEEQKAKIKPLLESIETGISRATGIINSMNYFSRNSDKGNQECDLHKIIDNCLLILRNEIKDRIKIEKDYTNATFNLRGNEGQLHQVFLNILTNSCHAIEGMGEIFISTTVKNKNINVIIRDNGVGISEENLSMVMDPFFTTKDPGKGTGLGMAIVYTIIEQHKGVIKYESDEGVGTTVKVMLPIT